MSDPIVINSSTFCFSPFETFGLPKPRPFEHHIIEHFIYKIAFFILSFFFIIPSFTMFSNFVQVEEVIEALQEEVDRQDKDIHSLQSNLKEAENLLVGSIHF